MSDRMSVLSIDLDYFVEPPQYDCAIDSEDRISEDECSVREIDEVVAFLENNCKISRGAPTKGSIITHHDEAYDYLHMLIKAKSLIPPFDLYHLDAHADLGLGSSGWSYLGKDVLNRPLDQRSENLKRGFEGLNLGNWLAFCIANRWVHSVTVSKKGNTWPFESYFIDEPKEKLQLYPLAPDEDTDKYIRKPFEYFESHTTDEPVVKYNYFDENEFFIVKNPDFIVLAKSPQYTPSSSDLLFNELSKFVVNI